MKDGNDIEGGMFRKEPAGWLAAMGVLGMYAALFFGFNAVRCAVDGRWMPCVVLMAGAFAGAGMVRGVVREARRRSSGRAGRRAKEV